MCSTFILKIEQKPEKIFKKKKNYDNYLFYFQEDENSMNTYFNVCFTSTTTTTTTTIQSY